MKKYYILILICTFYFKGHAQWNLISEPDWHIVYTSTQFINDTVGFVAGYYGYDEPVEDSLIYSLILKTTDGGNNWDTLKFPLIKQINCMHFVTLDIGYAAGGAYEYNILKTTDGGDTWQHIPLSIPNVSTQGFYFTEIHFLNPDTGFCSSGWPYFLVKTEDGGLSWSAILMPVDLIYGYPKAYTLHFIDSFGVTSYGWKTFDYGASWFINPDPFPPISVPNILFFDQDYGISAGNEGMIGKVGVTNNGGQTWIINYFYDFDEIHCLYGLNENEAYIAGSNQSEHIFMKTTDRGQTWYYQEHVTDTFSGQIFDIDFPSPKVGYAVGNFGLIYKTINSGGDLIPLSSHAAGAHQQARDLLIYPNPASNKIVIESNIQISHVKIFSSQGKLLQKENCPGNNVIVDISALPPGNYFIRAISREEVFVRKFVVVR